MIAIADPGIAAAIRGRSFAVLHHQGPGKDLEQVCSVTVDKHHDSLTFDTELGAGTAFHYPDPIAITGRDALAPEAAPPGLRRAAGSL